MTTNTTPSQAASIADYIEFWNLIEAYGAARGPATKENLALCAYIDTKLAQAREEATGMLAIAFEKMLCAAIGRDWSAVGISASSLVDDLRNRAIAAESRLAEIQRGVEGLQRYGFDGTFGGDFGKHSLGCYVNVDAVLALLQPQGQAATTMMRTELPQGWKLVPVEPTEEMMDSCRGGFITALAMPAFVAAYKTMVESAPQTLQTKDGLYALDNLSTKADDEGKIINDTSGLPG